jgi:hypothetical protein
MPSVITEGSALTCAHQGRIQLRASQRLLTVDGQAVLLQGDLEGAPISGCTTPATPTSKPCLTVVSTLTGPARTLSVGGKPALLENASGLTDGVTPAPTNQWLVQSAGQTKLTAS